MSLGASKSSSKQTSTQALTPNNDALLQNVTDARAVRDQPVTPYAGDLGSVGYNTDTGGATSALQGLLGYNAPKVSTAQNVSQDQIDHYMNPYTDSVVNATLADNERQRQMAITQGQGAATAAGAYGGSRHGVADSLTNEAAFRTGDTAAANLRQAGFNSAVGFGQQDLTRLLGADTSNQAADVSAAGVRGGAATGLGNIMTQQAAQKAATDQANQKAAYDEWVRQQNQGLLGQQLVNQSFGLLYNGPLTQSNGSSSSFALQGGLPPAPV